MDARVVSSQRKFVRCLSLAGAIAIALSGCQQPLLLSQRFAAEPHLAASATNGVEADTLGREGDCAGCDSPPATLNAAPLIPGLSVARPSNPCGSPGAHRPCPIGLSRWYPPILEHSSELLWTEQELQPPHSRFHPVPTQPVFGQRVDYADPQLMMELKEADRGRPRLLPQ